MTIEQLALIGITGLITLLGWLGSKLVKSIEANLHTLVVKLDELNVTTQDIGQRLGKLENTYEEFVKDKLNTLQRNIVEERIERKENVKAIWLKLEK